MTHRSLAEVVDYAGDEGRGASVRPHLRCRGRVDVGVCGRHAPREGFLVGLEWLWSVGYVLHLLGL